MSGIPPLQHRQIRADRTARVFRRRCGSRSCSRSSPVHNLLDGRIGRAMRALRRSGRRGRGLRRERAATKLKLFVFRRRARRPRRLALRAFPALGRPGPFGVIAGTEYLLMAVLGGAGRIYGAMLGATAITFLRDQLQNILPRSSAAPGNYEIVVFGAVLVFALQAAPSGLWPMMPVLRARRGLPQRRPAHQPLAPGRARARRAVARRRIALCKSFGGLVAVNDVGFDVRAGEILAPDRPERRGQEHDVQPDLTGALTPNSGAILLSRRVDRRSDPAADRRTRPRPHFPARAAIVADMSVIGERRTRRPPARRGRLAARACSGSIGRKKRGCSTRPRARLQRVGLADHAHQLAGSAGARSDCAWSRSRGRCARSGAAAAGRTGRRPACRREEGARRPAARTAQRGRQRSAGRARHGFRDEPRRPASSCSISASRSPKARRRRARRSRACAKPISESARMSRHMLLSCTRPARRLRRRRGRARRVDRGAAKARS